MLETFIPIGDVSKFGFIVKSVNCLATYSVGEETSFVARSVGFLITGLVDCLIIAGSSTGYF